MCINLHVTDVYQLRKIPLAIYAWRQQLCEMLLAIYAYMREITISSPAHNHGYT